MAKKQGRSFVAKNSPGSRIEDQFRTALERFQEGRLQEAEALLSAVRRADPRNGDAAHLLGLIAYRLRQLDRAVSCLQQAEGFLKGSPFVSNNLGVALKESGRSEEAVAAYRRAIKLKPDYAEAHNNLGNALKDLGMVDDAIEAYNESLRVRPADPETLNNLGNALREAGRLDHALAVFKEAIEVRPNLILFHLYRNMGNALKDRGQSAEAIVAYEKAIEVKPDYGDAHIGLGNLFKDLGRTESAIAEYQKAIDLRPDNAEAFNNMGNIFRERGLIERATESYLSALRLKPDFAEVLSNLGNVRKDSGDISGAVESYGKALALKPELTEAHSNLIYAKQFLPGISLEDILRGHMEWNARHVAPTRGKRFPHDPASRRSGAAISLGFVSGDFRHHPVAYFTISVLEALYKKECRIVCYASQREEDQMTGRFKAASHLWRDCAHLTDDRLARTIYEDGVEILFDLTGHNERNRLMAFAMQPAPVQITWAGYMATTGVETIDYIIADHHEIPEGSERFYTEKVIRMPHSFVCYDPPAYAPTVAPLPALTNGYVTFGCFNILAKISDEVIRLWSDILRQTPRSRLILKTKEFNSAGTRRRYETLFLKEGIDAGRIDLIGGTPHIEHLEYYNRVDIALDPFPFSGSTTTLESLWMGVPVITMPGETFAGRHSLSFLSTVGLTEAVASDAGEYAGIACRMADDVQALSEMRSSLRERFRLSPLSDGDGFAQNLLEELSRIRL